MPVPGMPERKRNHIRGPAQDLAPQARYEIN
jgi:hypothetical protein